MSKKRIETMRRKFIFIASLSFFLVMLMMGGLIFLINLAATQNEIHSILDYIVANDGDLEKRDRKTDERFTTADDAADTMDDIEEDDILDEASIVRSLQKIFGIGQWAYSSAEFKYATRYFAVLFDENGNVTDVKTNHIASVEKETAKEYARIALTQFFRFGSFDDYYYEVAERENGGTIVVYMESTRQISATNRLLYTALSLIGIGSLVTLMLVRTFSYRIVREELKSIQMQDQFLTNASHELKTPLAVIKANTEVEQMLNGENEWNESTMRQVERMTGLIQNLIRIVRAEEKENNSPIENIHVTAIIQETIDTFEPIALQEEKQLASELDSDVHFFMSEGDLRQLVSLLLDNAIKYCDKQGTIRVLMKAKGKTMRLSVLNSYAEGEDVDYSRFFERFYRKDESHNVDRGGYGVGLSIAENLVEKYRGTINATWKNGDISFNCVLHLQKK